MPRQFTERQVHEAIVSLRKRGFDVKDAGWDKHLVNSAIITTEQLVGISKRTYAKRPALPKVTRERLIQESRKHWNEPLAGILRMPLPQDKAAVRAPSQNCATAAPTLAGQP